ncbi:MAG TPA: DUF5134 domain-containing protein [Streptosporangiaceae bacterium]|nr:DUF5134 domain-containing protein [Streptosporangiaceae bacterium]
MVGNEVSRWVLSALFAGLGAWYLAAAACDLFRAGHRRRPGPAVSAGLCVSMCVVMIGMSWSWGAGIPAIAQVTVFTAGGGWFAGQALFGARTGAGNAAEPVGALAGGHSASWYHAGMMAAMVWMAVAMSALTAPATVLLVSGTAGPAEPTDSMAGMAAGAGPGPAAMATGAPAWWVSAGCLLASAAFFAAALYFAATLFFAAASERRPRRGALLGTGTGALMAAGMAVTFLEIART